MNTTTHSLDDCATFVNAVRRARKMRDFCDMDRTETFRSLCEDLDRDAGDYGAGSRDIAVSAVVAAFCAAEN